METGGCNRQREDFASGEAMFRAKSRAMQCNPQPPISPKAANEFRTGSRNLWSASARLKSRLAPSSSAAGFEMVEPEPAGNWWVKVIEAPLSRHPSPGPGEDLRIQIINCTELLMWGRLSSLPWMNWQAGKPAPVRLEAGAI
jgi:hypothetical protein